MNNLKIEIAESGKPPISIEFWDQLDNIDNIKSDFNYEDYGIKPKTNEQSPLKSNEVSPVVAAAIFYGVSFLSSAISVAIQVFVAHVKRMRRLDVENFWKNNKHFSINNKNHIVTIKHINARAFLRRLSEMYTQSKVGTTVTDPEKDKNKDSPLAKMFDIKYGWWDHHLYKKGEMRKKELLIKSLSFNEFFAMEVVNLLNQLAEEYDMSSYTAMAQRIIDVTYLKHFEEAKIVEEPLKDKVKKELKDNPLLKHQEEFVRKYNSLKQTLNLRGFILSFDQGLGKTLTSISLSYQLGKDQLVVVCPNTLTLIWAEEICSKLQTYKSNPDKQLEDIYVQNDSNKNRFVVAKDPKIIIANYESIEKVYKYIKSDKSTLLVIDECQNYRYITGKRWSQLYQLIQNIYDSDNNKLDVLPMSGTPIKAHPSEIVPAMMCIDPLFTEDIAKKYVAAFSINNESAQDIVNQRFKLIIYRKTKAKTLNLPPKHEENVYWKISGDESRFYIETVEKEISDRFDEVFAELKENAADLFVAFEEMVNKYCKGANPILKLQYLSFLKNTIVKDKRKYVSEYKMSQFYEFANKYIRPNIKDKEELKKFNKLETDFVRMRQKAMGIAIGEILPKRREEMFCKLIDDNPDKITEIIDNSIKKVAMFSNSLGVINKLEEYCKSNDIGYVKITGSNAKDRKFLIDKFIYDEECEVLIGTNKTMGVGVTITCANAEIIFGPPWRKADFEQLTDRIHRIGQTTECFIYNVGLETMEPNLSDRMNTILEWSGNMTNSYMEDIFSED